MRKREEKKPDKCVVGFTPKLLCGVCEREMRIKKDKIGSNMLLDPQLYFIALSIYLL